MNVCARGLLNMTRRRPVGVEEEEEAAFSQLPERRRLTSRLSFNVPPAGGGFTFHRELYLSLLLLLLLLLLLFFFCSIVEPVLSSREV